MELIKIYQGNLVSAKELHAFLGVGRDFSTWFSQRVKRYSFIEKKDFTPISGKSTGGRPSKDYAVTLSMAKQLAMVENNDNGRAAREYFIQAEEALKALAKNKRFETFTKLETTKEKFKNTLLDKGLTEEDYIEIDAAGRKVFLNGKEIPDEQLETILLSARDFATNMTQYDMLKDGLNLYDDIEASNKQNHTVVRKTLLDKGIEPENLPARDDIKKLKE
ncbi:antA/AntB antirepressor family protein [Chondrinema litorale]|uniref:antA/AntB antirepressor family protein n=1 Tax=Chondrinema litorale TaxID=2994555 RepID=UPI002542D6FC|nr:antA/AntB antirepressor family protein [Chondrinema litorale]UZR99983.1 antA/AntB antirepressor family protein [Chondrinema litorale]